jgi:hypothetical protein
METPVVQEAPFDHTYCTASTCFGEAEPSPVMTAHETRVYFESYLGLNGLVLSDTSATDTSDSDYVPGGRTFIPEIAPDDTPTCVESGHVLRALRPEQVIRTRVWSSVVS